ncbi:MAG: bifunctional hydroxymethylpyrimidine kinase/phosphomethylpyrimidine kinase [Candidatus Hydrogenedentes bacterium]|nr:bifunctional hydroxymethylpyrimidine kinase/phosphomethylpyrimidine kinase [Candidatus Hydrogenedentota bacterium]MBI3118499.1 bifunctional hydroxymethylpyrimidine kinase/phosphomethylpyrimidine kinase [Candidatus Hydrogenedentota bacterium]
MIPRILTIAGSDSGGGAGIQADLKTIAALGGYGMSAITALTAQNTVGVLGISEVAPEFVQLQISAVLGDIGADAAKTGMLSSAAIIAAVASELERHPLPHLVIDPVMVAKSGDRLLRDDACSALVQRLLPLASVVTPNIPEAEVLSGVRIEGEASLREAASRIHALMRPTGTGTAAYVLMKGGHLRGPEAIDWLFDGQRWRAYSAPRLETKNTHGTGCTYAAGIATMLGKGLAIEQAVQAAKDFLTGAMQQGLPLGSGHGPLHHGWQEYPLAPVPHT